VCVDVAVGDKTFALYCDPAAPISALGPLLQAAMEPVEADESDSEEEEEALEEEVACSKRALENAKAALAAKKKARRV